MEDINKKDATDDFELDFEYIENTSEELSDSSDLDDFDFEDNKETDQEEIEGYDAQDNDDVINSEDDVVYNDKLDTGKEKEISFEKQEDNAKKSKKKLNKKEFNIGKNKNKQSTEDSETPNEPPKDLILYVITDRANPAMLGYFREYGIKLSKIFTNIRDAQDTLLMQVEPAKIVVVDTGTGRFSNMGSRKEIVDLMGICDENARISVFYTDTAIKSEVEYLDTLDSKQIEWFKYKSTPDIVANLLKLHETENYVYDENDKDSIQDVSDNILDIRGLKVKELKQINIGEPSISINDILINMVNSTDESDKIEGYNVKI